MQKSQDEIVIGDTNEEFDEVLREAGMKTSEEARAALREVLSNLQDHPLNAQRGEPVIIIPGINVHFRLAPTLYTAFIATLGVAVTVATLPAAPIVALGAATVAGAGVLKDVGGLFNRLNAQEATVVGALNDAITERRKTDPNATDATADQVEAVFRARNQAPPAVLATLQHLVGEKVVNSTPRDGNIYFRATR